MPLWHQLTFQEGTSTVAASIDSFHDYSMGALILITGLLSVVMMGSSAHLISTGGFTDHEMLEGVWTIIPGLILIALAVPSLVLLYLSDASAPSITLSVVGHQWYWEYAMPGLSNTAWDSYMMTSDLSVRNLDVDNRCWLPMSLPSRVMVSSADVLHAWSVNSLGLKMDAVPGRLNQTTIQPGLTGVYYGQCSELCGANHSFMPIVVEVTPLV